MLPNLPPHKLVQAKTWFPSNEMQKSPNLTNEPLYAVKPGLIFGHFYGNTKSFNKELEVPIRPCQGFRILDRTKILSNTSAQERFNK